MKALIFCIITFTVFFESCCTPMNIEGLYCNKNELNRFELYSDSTFIYNSLPYKNSSFINKYSDGKWKRINKYTVILNSRITNNTIPLLIEMQSIEDSCIKVCEKLVIIPQESDDKYKNEDFLVTPYLDGNNYLDLHPELSDEPLYISKNDFRKSIGLEPDTTNPLENGMFFPPIKRGSYCFYPEKAFNTLYFKIEKQPKILTYSTFYTLQTEVKEISIQSGEVLEAKICVNDSLFSYRIFDNTILNLKGNKLIFKDKEDNNKTNKLIKSK